MDFMMIAKDWKESWAAFSELISDIKKLGYLHHVEHGGDEFGIDGDFMVFSNSEEVYNVSSEFVQAGYFELDNEENDEDEEGSVLSSYKKDENGNYILYFKNGEQHRMMMPPWNN